MRTSILLTGTLVCFALAATEAHGQIDKVRFRYAQDRAEKFLDVNSVPKLPSTAFGAYEYEFFAGEMMTMKLDLTAGVDSSTGEFLYTSAISMAQPTGPNSSFLLSDTVNFRATLALVSSVHDYKLTSPAYHEETKSTLKLERGQIVIESETVRGAGAPPSATKSNFPMVSTQIHKSLVYVFASICREAPRGEPLGVTIYESTGATYRAMFTRTGQTKAIDALGASFPCIEVEVIAEERSKTLTDRYYIDELGRVLSQESDLNKSKAALRLVKFTPIGAPAQTPATEAASNHIRAEDLVDDAEDLLGKQKLLRATRRIVDALELEPTNARALAFRTALQKRVDTDFAALKPSDPNYIEVLTDLSRVQERIDQKHPNFAKMTAALGKR